MVTLQIANPHLVFPVIMVALQKPGMCVNKPRRIDEFDSETFKQIWFVNILSLHASVQIKRENTFPLTVLSLSALSSGTF